MNRLNNVISIIIVLILFICCLGMAIVINEFDYDEPKITVINETYNPPEICGKPIIKNYTTTMRKEIIT